MTDIKIDDVCYFIVKDNSACLGEGL